MNTGAVLPLLVAQELSLSNVLILAAGIFCVGVYGVLSRQNLLVLLMCVELILNGANLAIVAFGRALAEQPNPEGVGAAAGHSHAFVVIVLAVAAAEAAVGLAIVLAVYRKWRTIHGGEISSLSG